MLTQNDLVARWRAIPQYNGGYQLVDATHPLHWYVGYSDVGRRTLMLIAGARFKQLQSSRSISAAAATGRKVDTFVRFAAVRTVGCFCVFLQ